MLKERFIPLMIPDIQQQDIDALTDVLRSGMLIQGKKVEEFEHSIANYLNVKHAIAISNGTATLHLALLAYGIGKGDEVIVPAFSYIATANVVELVGATPIFVDIDRSTFNINTDLLELAITSKTKAIIPVHEFGLACNISEICEIAKKHELIVIEDAACALGAKENDRFAGTFGQIGSFSFHPRKAITSGEGGMLVTNDDDLAKKIRILRNHGIDMIDGKMEFVDAGYNYRMTDFQAALVHSQLKRLPDILDYKRGLSEIYFEDLGSNANLSLPYAAANKVHTWQSFHILLNDTIDRDQFFIKMNEHQIGVNYGAQCMPSQIFFKKKYKLNVEAMFPNALNAYKQGVVLPLYEKLNSDDLHYIAATINSLLT